MKFFRKGSGDDPGAISAREPIVLRSDRLVFAVGVTRRRDIELKVGPSIKYPAAGWQTWTVAGLRGQSWILSVFYRNNVLIGVEHYLPKTENLPAYAPRIKGFFTLSPGEIGLGSLLANIGPSFVSSGGRNSGVRAVVYAEGFESRWTSGVALVSGNDGRVERLAVYGTTG